MAEIFKNYRINCKNISTQMLAWWFAAKFILVLLLE